MSKSEKQNIKLDKVDDKTAYENLLVKYAELENKIADIKANCDLAIEGRDIKIKELEQELTVEKDQHQEEINLHLHAEEYIESLEKEIKELKHNKKTVVHLADCLEEKMKERIEELERLNSNQAESLRVTMLEEEKKGKRIEELEKENAELKQINSETLTQLNLDNGELIIENEKLRKENEKLRNNGFTVSAITEQQLKVAIEKGKQLEKENKKVKQGCHKWFMRWREVKREELEVFSKIEELEKENADLKAEIENDRDIPTVAYMQGAENQKKKDEKQLTKAKEIIKNCVCIIYRLSPTTALLDKNERSLLKQAEQFIKEIKK